MEPIASPLHQPPPPTDAPSPLPAIAVTSKEIVLFVFFAKKSPAHRIEIETK